MNSASSAVAGAEPDRDRAQPATVIVQDQRSVTEIVTDLWEKAENLIRQELKLGLADAEERVEVLKTELEQRVSQLKVELTMKALGGAVVFAGLLALTAALVLLLSRAVTPWLAALIVGLVVSAVGAALLMRQVRKPELHASELIPRRAIENMQQDVHTIEESVK